MAQGQAKFLDEAPSTKAGRFLAQGHHSVLQGIFSSVRTGLGGPALGAQAGVALILEEAEPLFFAVTRSPWHPFPPGGPKGSADSGFAKDWRS